MLNAEHRSKIHRLDMAALVDVLDGREGQEVTSRSLMNIYLGQTFDQLAN